MSALDPPLRNAALNLMAKFGASMTITHAPDPGAHDPVSGTSTPATPIVTSIKGMIDAYSLQNLGDDSTGLLQEGDQKVTIAAAAISYWPRPGDFLTITGNNWSVYHVQPIHAGDLPATFILSVRK